MAMGAMHIGPVFATMQVNSLVPFFTVCMAPFTMRTMVEAAGDVHTLILDKTGTITVGNRQATEFIPLEGVRAGELVQEANLASYFDTTPEGRTIVAFAEKQGAQRTDLPDQARPLDFSAETRMSGLDLPDGRIVRKGAGDAVVRQIAEPALA
jgi:K+-transporting ATPase ATPase B chain